MDLGLVVTDQSWLDEAALRAIDATGFRTLSVVDHPSFPNTDAWTWLAWAAGKTTRIRLGTHVTGAPFHHPHNLARQVATVDVLSGGRATLGIGTGYEHADFHPFGYVMLTFRGRVELLEEMLTVINALWTEDTATFRGTYFHLDGGAKFLPKPVQQPRPPILVGLNTAGLALRAAARCADGINTWQLGPAQLAALKPAIHAACAEARRDPAAFLLTSDVLLARGATHDTAEKLAERISTVARGWGRSKRVTQWDAGGVLHGDATAIASQALAFAGLGVSELSIAVSSLDDILWLDDEVLPLIRR